MIQSGGPKGSTPSAGAHARQRHSFIWAFALLFLILSLAVPLDAQGAVQITFNPEPPSEIDSSADSVDLTVAIQATSSFAPEVTCTYFVTVTAQAEADGSSAQEFVRLAVAGDNSEFPPQYGAGEIIDSNTLTLPVNQAFRDAEGFTVAISNVDPSCPNNNGFNFYPFQPDSTPRSIAISAIPGEPGSDEDNGNGGVVDPVVERVLTERQQRVADALSNACAAVSQIPQEQRTSRQDDLITTCAVASDAPGSIYDSLAPEEVAAQGRISMQAMRQQLQNVSTRIGELRTGATGVSTRGLNIALQDTPIPVNLLADALGGGASSDILAFSQWGFFVNGSVSLGRRDQTTNEPGFRNKSFGLTSGVDYRFSPKTVAGVALGVTHTDTDLRDDAGGVDVNGYSMSLYGTHFASEAFYLDGIATLGHHRYDTVRTVFSGPDGQSAKAKPSGTELALGLNSGYDFYNGPWTTSLQTSFDYVRVEIDGYNERPSHPDNLGAGALLHIGNQTIESKTAEGAVQLSYAASQPWGVMLYTTRLGIEREFSDDSRRINARFVEDPTNSSFSLRTDTPDRTYMNLGAGLTAQMAQGRAAYLFFDSVNGRSGYSLYRIDLGLRIEF